MKHFTIDFRFGGQSCQASAMELDGLDDVQYAISPRDETLALRFGTNVLKRDKDEKEWHYTLPSDPEAEAFMAALAQGLDTYLKSH